eukprot:s3606_g8.t2
MRAKVATVRPSFGWGSFSLEELLEIAAKPQSRSDRRCDEHNGNNEAFWQKLGYDRRPDDWEERYAAIRVMIAGSRAKKTDLATSDQDYYIAWETPVTLQTREDLQEELEKRFLGAVEVTKHGTLRVPGESGQLCITFARAIFYDESFEERARLDKDAFKHNRPAQQAVRAVKLKLQDAGIKVKGHTLERAVLTVQEEHPDASFYDLAKETLDALGLRDVFC